MDFYPSASGAGSLTGEAVSADQFLQNLTESGLYSRAETRELTARIPAARRGDGPAPGRLLGCSHLRCPTSGFECAALVVPVARAMSGRMRISR